MFIHKIIFKQKLIDFLFFFFSEGLLQKVSWWRLVLDILIQLVLYLQYMRVTWNLTICKHWDQTRNQLWNLQLSYLLLTIMKSWKFKIWKRRQKPVKYLFWNSWLFFVFFFKDFFVWNFFFCDSFLLCFFLYFFTFLLFLKSVVGQGLCRCCDKTVIILSIITKICWKVRESGKIVCNYNVLRST